MTQEEISSLKGGERIFPIYFDGQKIGIPRELEYYFIGNFSGGIKVEVILGQSLTPLNLTPNAFTGSCPSWATERTLEQTCIQLIEEWKEKELKLANGILQKQQNRISELLKIDPKEIVKEQLKHKSHFNVV